MAALIEVIDPTDPNDVGFIILGLSGKFFDNANTRSYDVTLRDSIEMEVIASTPANAYPEMTNGREDVEGRCVVIARGTNTFTSKYEQAMSLNAAAVLIANNNNAQPTSVLTLYGQIADDCFHDRHFEGDKFPPCMMISYDSHSHLLKQFNVNPIIKVRMRPVKAVDLPLLTVDDLGVIIRSSCIFDNHPLLLESLAYLFHKTSLPVAPNNAFSLASSSSNPEESNRLITIGKVIEDVEVGRGANSLHLAVEQNNLPCLSTLLKTSLSTEIRKDDGYTGLHLATEHGRYDAVALLLASGAYIDHPHPIGWTALHFAVYCEHLAIVTLLCEQGASVNALSIDGNSPLHVAAKIGADACLRKMLEYSVADIFRSQGPMTVLQCAQQNNHIGCCRILHDYSKRIRTAHPAGVITWSGQSRMNMPLQPSFSGGTDSYFNSEKINILGVCSNPSMLLMDYWYQCCNISAQSSNIINLSISSSASLDETTQQLLTLDLERCCFPEYRNGIKCKLLKTILVTILSGCKTITYRQGMMSLLIPIIEANYYNRSYQVAENSQASPNHNHTMEANVVNKSVMMFHTILSLFPAIGNYYSILESKRNTAVPQLEQAILPLMRFHYPMIYTALAWNEVSLLMFIIPWISTLMAHVLPLKDTLRLWSALFEMYSVKRLASKSNTNSGVNSGASSAASTPRTTSGKRSPRSSMSSTNNCDMFLVYMVIASLKSLEQHMVSTTTATTLVIKESATSSFVHSRSNSIDLTSDASATIPTGPENSLRKLLESKLSSAVHTASTAVQSASESLSKISTPTARGGGGGGGNTVIVVKQYAIQSDEHIMQLLTSINNATSLVLEAVEKKIHTEMNILGYIDGRGNADSAPSPNLFASIGNILNAHSAINSGAAGGGLGQSGAAVGTSGSSRGGGQGSNSTVQHLLSMYYNSSSAAASGTATPVKGNTTSKPTPTHFNQLGMTGGPGVMLHVSSILPVLDNLTLTNDINSLIVTSQKIRSEDLDRNDLSMWESFTVDVPRLSVFAFTEMLASRPEGGERCQCLILEVSPDSVPFANFQVAVPSLHSYHHKRHAATEEASGMSREIMDCVKGLYVDNSVEVYNIDQLQVLGLMDYLQTFAVSVSTRVKLNKKAKDEYMKLSALPNLPMFLRSLIASKGTPNSYVLVVPADVNGPVSEELAGVMSSLANTLTICGVEQVILMNAM